MSGIFLARKYLRFYDDNQTLKQRIKKKNKIIGNLQKTNYSLKHEINTLLSKPKYSIPLYSNPSWYSRSPTSPSKRYLTSPNKYSPTSTSKSYLTSPNKSYLTVPRKSYLTSPPLKKSFTSQSKSSFTS